MAVHMFAPCGLTFRMPGFHSEGQTETMKEVQGFYAALYVYAYFIWYELINKYTCNRE